MSIVYYVISNLKNTEPAAKKKYRNIETKASSLEAIKF